MLSLRFEREATVQARTLCIQSPDAPALSGSSQHAEQSGKGPLGQAQADMIQQADTFFVATHHEAEADDPVAVKSGNDISHRGGPPGFVQLEAPDRIRWPDYVGNNFFQTLGGFQGVGHTPPVLLQCSWVILLIALAWSCIREGSHSVVISFLGMGSGILALALIAIKFAGNIHANHQAGLLFVDFETGSTLQISGEVPIYVL